jgi:hypothetical protein
MTVMGFQMDRTFRRRIFPFVIILLASAPFGWARDVALVANKGNTVKEVPLAELVKLAKAATKKWPDGKAVIVVMKDPGLPEMKVALQKVFGMSMEEVKALVAANKESLLIVDSDQALLRIVAAKPGAVGLIDVYSINSEVDVVKVDGKLPLQPGYVLHGN